jgi:acyl carrier protein
MNDLTTLARVKALIGDQLGKAAADVGDDEVFEMDSLDKIELGIFIGDHFDIEIPDADLDKPEMGTAAGIAAYIDGRLAEQPVPADVTETVLPIIASLVGQRARTIESLREPPPPPFAITTGDPRFNADGQVTVNGYLFERVR